MSNNRHIIILNSDQKCKVIMKSKFTIILLLFFCLSQAAAQDFKILSSDENSLVVEYTPTISDTQKIIIDGESYLRFDVNYTVPDDNKSFGEKESLLRVFTIGVPSEFGNTIQILSSSFNLIPGKIAPVPDRKIESLEYKINEEYYKKSESEIIMFGDFGYIRNLSVQNIKIKPIVFDEETGSIKVFSKIVFRVNFGNSGIANSVIDDELVEASVINYETAKKWGKAKRRLSKPNSDGVLAEGNWFRFETPEEGIYKIDRNTLNSIGIDPDVVDPRNIKIYNNGGYMLPEAVPDEVPAGLNEVAIEVIGGSDGKFDTEDYILFYGRGINFWEYDTGLKIIVRRNHYYSNTNYYYITADGAAGKRTEIKPSENSTSPFNQDVTEAFAFYDENKINVLSSGRIYFSDEYSFSNKSHTYINSLGAVAPGTIIDYKFQFGNVSQGSRQLNIYENDNQLFSRYISGGTDEYNVGRLNSASLSYDGILPENRSALKFLFEATGLDDKGYLDYFEIYYTKLLRPDDNLLVFFSEDTTSVIEYTLHNFSTSDISIYDITDYANVKKIEPAKISGGQTNFQSGEVRGERSKYIALTNSKLKTPVNFESVENSTLTLKSNRGEYLIITDERFAEQAEQLKNYKENEAPEKLITEVAYVKDILNSFSGGQMDPTAIRNFISYAFKNWEVPPMYVLLFGDGTYDYLNIEGMNNNYVPTYQTYRSLHEYQSYAMDDYFGRIDGADKKADIALGRITINSNQDAETVIDKIIKYETDTDKSIWRNTITLVADDGPTTGTKTDGTMHTNQSEGVAQESIPENFSLNKIYLAEYSPIFVGSGRRKPEVNDAIVTAINNGTLVVNYIGHGNPKVWAHENVFEQATTIPRLNNDKYFFLSAATCDFALFDNPNVQSSAEDMLVMNNAGIIGAVAAVRPVLSGSNYALNRNYFNKLLKERDSKGLPRRIGVAYMLTKQERTADNDERFHLFGDPSLRLNIPQIQAHIEKVNNKPVDTEVTISALGKVEIQGSVRNADSSASNFMGEGIISVYDSEKLKSLEPQLNYKMVEQGGLIFRGRVSVNNGEFNANFVVPKDISYEDKNGKIVAYIYNDYRDGIGFTNNIKIAGTDTTLSDDKDGPGIEIFYDNESMENSFLVNPDFKLIVHLEDETGLNTTGTGLGHRLEAVLNDDKENAIDLTEYFIGDLDAGGKSGRVEYKFSDIEPGEYSIKINAWDVYNNFSSEESYFTVVNEEGLVVRNVYNYPNPFQSNTAFTFQHNIPGPVNVRIKVYTIAGRMIKEIEKIGITDKFVKVMWDGRDEDFNLIANGTYLYKLIVETMDGGSRENILGKLAVIR